MSGYYTKSRADALPEEGHELGQHKVETMRGAAFESAQADYALVGAAAELEGDVLLRLEERSVDENVRERQHPEFATLLTD